MFKRRKPDEIGGTTPSAPDTGPAAPATLQDVGMPSPDPFKSPARPAEPGAGMPPPRAIPKESPAMGRTPYPSPTPAVPPSPAAPPAPGMAAGPRPGIPGRGREPAERRTLVVGRGISVQGTVADAERLVVEGTVEASMIHATELSIAQGGVFKGAVEVEDAEIAGVIDGTLTARATLIVRATGKVMGTAHYRRLQVEDGGQITGELKMITEPARPAPTPESSIA